MLFDYLYCSSTFPVHVPGGVVGYAGVLVLDQCFVLGEFPLHDVSNTVCSCV